MKYQLKIKRDGTLEFLGAPPPGLKLPGATTRRRFSEIVPVNPALRVLFRVLRWVFGEEGRVAEWTRTWRCRWEAMILRGPMCGTRKRSPYRQELLHWERQVWLDRLARRR